ncbi:hypothetical protein Vadar_013092 [Vaccinium darrowii]|uniref:Uncharacterized protein n=1 Tax=Vaccinium darrowii TaxID=229202 RepID=A0ACB7Z439_9ERIC|nr:hypothetical protein Vadar_013092 [Vaccinium darrowii]
MDHQQGRKPRVLCLHGYRTSGKIFEKQTEIWPEFDFSEYRNFEASIAFIEDYMTRSGPFDGLLGFSQGAFISAALPGMQAKGVALTSVPRIKFVMIISGAKLGGLYSSPKLAENAFPSPVECTSLHFLGEKDYLKPNGMELLDSFLDPLVIYYPEGHEVPKLDEKGSEIMLKFIEKVQELL